MALAGWPPATRCLQAYICAVKRKEKKRKEKKRKEKKRKEKKRKEKKRKEKKRKACYMTYYIS